MTVNEKDRLTDFTHLPLGEEIEAISGRFSILKEEVFEFQGRPVLYLVGYGIFDASCCGAGGGAYALVPGYLLEKRYRQDLSGLAVSKVEPIRDEALKKEISSLIREREHLQQINFL